MRQVARLIADVLAAPEDAAILARVADEVRDLTDALSRCRASPTDLTAAAVGSPYGE